MGLFGALRFNDGEPKREKSTFTVKHEHEVTVNVKAPTFQDAQRFLAAYTAPEGFTVLHAYITAIFPTMGKDHYYQIEILLSSKGEVEA